MEFSATLSTARRGHYPAFWCPPAVARAATGMTPSLTGFLCVIPWLKVLACAGDLPRCITPSRQIVSAAADDQPKADGSRMALARF